MLMNLILTLTKCHQTKLFSSSHNCLYGQALMWYTGGRLLRVFTKEGRLRAAVAFGRVNGGSLDSQFVLGSSPFGSSYGATRRLEPCDGSVGMTPGYPGQGLCKHVGDAVRETHGISVSLGMSSSLLTGLVPRILWDMFRGF